MLRVALTGGVGSGKSAVADMLRTLGAKLSQSDEIGRAMMQPGHAVFDSIVAHFGPTVLAADGSLDRRALARAAFEGNRLEELNALVHPAVIAAQALWMNAIAAEDAGAVAVVESALIFETIHGAAPWHQRFDRSVVVTAPVQVRRARFIQRSHSAEAAGADFDRRAAAQWSDERKAALADYVLQNDGTLQQLQTKVAELYARLHAESQQRARQTAAH